MNTPLNKPFAPRTVQVSGDIEMRLLPRSGYEASYVAATDCIGFAFETQSGEHAFASDRRVPFRTHPNSLSYVPPGCDVYSRSSTGGEYLLISARRATPFSANRFNDVVSLDATVSACALRRSFLQDSCAEPVDVESEILRILEVVASVLDGTARAPAAARWMTRHRLRRVDDLIESRMHLPLSVSSMAMELNVSTEFFIRAFKAFVGRTPHDYLMERRVSHARMLLIDSSKSLAAISAECGFSSQAHMATSFRRRLGVSPGTLRKSDD